MLVRLVNRKRILENELSPNTEQDLVSMAELRCLLLLKHISKDFCSDTEVIHLGHIR